MDFQKEVIYLAFTGTTRLLRTPWQAPRYRSIKVKTEEHAKPRAEWTRMDLPIGNLHWLA